MDVSLLLDSLNDAQRAAVSAPACNQLILAGAGSGKTRVLVHRIAWLIQVEKVSPYSIMAVTFTNKAAREMRARLDELFGQIGQPISSRTMWVGTFHGLAHCLLKAHWQDAKLPQNFQILDSDDQLVLMDEVLTPDSSRYWPADQYTLGSNPPSYDKQFLRDWLEAGQVNGKPWDKTPPSPRLPREVIEKTAAKYQEALTRLMG